MSMQVNTNVNTINWDTLLRKLDAATKSAETQGAGGVTAGQNITITATVNGIEEAITFPVPDDLELPKEVDQAGIDSLCEKLAGDSSFGLSAEEVQAVHDKLTEALAATTSSVSKANSNGSSTKVLFDIYQLMALLVEVAQKQRNASREMRTAENMQIQKSILDQANQQKTAALTGMIAGAICCAAQVIASVVTTAYQGKAFSKQIGSIESSGVASAKDNLTMLKAADTTAHAQTQLDKVTADVGGKSAGRMNRTIAQDVGEFGFENTDQAKAKLSLEQTKLNSLVNERQTIQQKLNDGTLKSSDVSEGPLKDALLQSEAFDQKIADSEIPRELVDRFIQRSNDAAKGTVSQADRVDLYNTANMAPELKDMGTMTTADHKANIQRAAEARLAELDNEIPTQRTATDPARQNIRTAVETDLQRYEDEYASALHDFNEINENTSAADATRIKNNLQLAGDKLKFARANAYNELAQPGVTTSAERAAAIRTATTAVETAEKGRMNDVEFIKASRTIQTGEAKMGLINAIGNPAQSFVQNLSAHMQADAKKAEAQNAKAQEELDQTKDLFNQAQDLIDSVVQLMQAISSAETQSMRDAIQA